MKETRLFLRPDCKSIFPILTDYGLITPHTQVLYFHFQAKQSIWSLNIRLIKDKTSDFREHKSLKVNIHTAHPFRLFPNLNGFGLNGSINLHSLLPKDLAFSSIQFALNATAVKIIVFILCLWIFLRHKSCPN